eukprot:CFRG5685T1
METVLIAMLRGINVSGKNSIKMIELKALFVSLGFACVKTYVQSGNVAFISSKADDTTKVSLSVKKALNRKYGYNVVVIVKALNELDEVIQAKPNFGEDVPATQLLVTFLASNPPVSEVKVLEKSLSDGDIICANDKFVVNIERGLLYVYTPGGYGKSKLNNNFFERKLKVDATTRNWRTVEKLHNIGSELADQDGL